MSDDLIDLDATGLAEVIASGEVSSLEAVEATIARIDQVDDQLNAVIHRMDDKARAEASSSDLPDGPFRGVPMLLKDLWPSSAGDPFHLGVKGLAGADYHHPTDSNITTAYRRAGFVIAGRTNTPELGLVATTEPEAYGPTRNPWNTGHGPGGSSGGAAAAVASGMVPAANASDGGGSIRIPAALCGLVGLKPSRGRISMGPLQEEWGLSVQHVVCHTVRDCAGILDATAYPFPGDGVVAPRPGRPYVDEVGAPADELRIGLLDHALTGDTHADCTRAAREVGETLAALGHHVEISHPEAMDRTEELTGSFIALWAAGARTSLNTIGAMLGREVTADDVEAGTWTLAEMGASFSGVDVMGAQAQAGQFRRVMAEWWADRYDLLLTPATAMPAPPLGQLTPTADDPMRGLYASIPYATFTSPFNTTGQPAISLPTHQSSEALPVGVQLAAAYGREDLLLRVAAQLEQALPWADRRPPVFASAT
jgi:amidase